MEYLKKAQKAPGEADPQIRARVEDMLTQIRNDGEAAVKRYARDLDGWDGDFVLSDEARAKVIAEVPQQEKDDLKFAHEQVVRVAEAQKASVSEFSVETLPGVHIGQKLVPVSAAGCYIPGGRYAHAASAIMSVATAKVAGVPFVTAASPPRGTSIAPAVVYAMDLAGADLILQMGGVHAIATMAFGLFGARPSDFLAGPGNAYVAEAKRQLFGEVGIDLFAGPTESCVIADETADPMTVAVDLASQAEHGPDSPVWLITTSREIGEAVAAIMPKLAKTMPSGPVVAQSWPDYGEIVLADSREEAVAVSDTYAPEHLQVIATDLPWWRDHLRNYGSLFLGEGATVTHGDKCSGTNHILPTKRAARYTGGLNVQKFLKVLTWQEISAEANKEMSAAASRISRVEGMDGHARACDWRLRKYFPGTNWDFDVADQERLD